ncbi:FimV/HubP family polar landmark protein [Vreelandella neptunia]|uniref:FimV/HubP family polar landmark protein n=1 Tax=Vreelandella neptunia TaxID=115551 RepID=UPI003159BD47
MKKTLTWITWLSLSAVSPLALAIGLGQASVSSYLNAPLDASMPLLESNQYALKDIQISVAEPSEFASVGLEWSPLVANVRAQVIEQQGQRQVVLSSQQSMEEPWLELLLTIDYPGGQHTREVTLLFDPQGYSETAAQGGTLDSAQNNTQENGLNTSQASNQGQIDASNALPVSTLSDSLTTEQSIGSEVAGSSSQTSAYVGSGDTLWGVAERIKPADASVQQMMVALLEANPNVFPSGNVHDMRAGRTLQVPDSQRVLARSRVDAASTIQAMNEAWRSRRNGSLQEVPLPPAERNVETLSISDLAIATAQAVQSNSMGTPDAGLAAAASEPVESEGSAPEMSEEEASRAEVPEGAEERDEQVEALTPVELTEQLRLSQATLQQVLDERELMRAEINALDSEVGSLNQALSESLAAQQQAQTQLAASNAQKADQDLISLIARYQWPLAAVAIVLLIGLLLLLRKRREESWEPISTLQESVPTPTASSSADNSTASPVQPTTPRRDSNQSQTTPFNVGTTDIPLAASETEKVDESQAASTEEGTSAENASPLFSHQQEPVFSTKEWFVNAEPEVPPQEAPFHYEKSQAAGLAEQGRQRRYEPYGGGAGSAEHTSLAPPPSARPLRAMLAAFSTESPEEVQMDSVQQTEPRTATDVTEGGAASKQESAETSASEEVSEPGHRFIDYQPPRLTTPFDKAEQSRLETPMQPTVEFPTESSAPSEASVRQPRRPIEEEWDIEEVAFKPRGLDNSDPSKSSK